MLKKEIIYCEKKCVLACDGNCEKAWSLNSRPRKDNGQEFKDNELCLAPANPETYEGEYGKPTDKTLNKWCARECERAVICDVLEKIELPKFD